MILPPNPKPDFPQLRAEKWKSHQTGSFNPPKSGIWGKAGERQEQILAKTLKNKGKYIAYERKSCISGWNVIQEAVKQMAAIQTQLIY